MKVTNDIYDIGVNDHDIDLFEGQYPVPDGMSYNSYVIMDEKIAVMDTVDIHFTQEWLAYLQDVLQGRTPDYLIIHHMEPDHSASIAQFMQIYPQTTLVGNVKTFAMLDQFFDLKDAQRKIVKNGDELSLGQHTLSFVLTPLVHWPEVMMSYEHTDHVLFSADAFGKFGAKDVSQDWVDEARRYYIGIVGKFGPQVQMALKKLSQYDIQIICSLHGPVLKDKIADYIHLYDLWSSYQPQSNGVLIAYTSVYGHTKEAAMLLKEQLDQRNVPSSLYDLARDDMSQAVDKAFFYKKTVLATTTYNNDIFPFMKTFIHHLTERNFQNRQIALIENGSWAPMANKTMKALLENCKNLSYCEHQITIKSSLHQDNIEHIQQLAQELAQ